MEDSSPPIDPKSGFCSKTNTFHSLRPPPHLPSETTPLSAASYALSLQSTSPWPDSTAALIDSSTGRRLSFSDFTTKIHNLSSSLRGLLQKNDVAFILSPNNTHIPVLYFSLLSIGVVASPANPVSTSSEISRQIELVKPVVAFATSATSHKLPKLKYGTILVDSPEFESMMMTTRPSGQLVRVEVSQSDVAALLYSSGTTGPVKGVMLTHRNLIAIVANFCSYHPEWLSPAVMLYTVPYFHVFGFFYCFKSVALRETVVVMERYELRKMLRAVEVFRVTHIAVAPPVVVAMVKGDMTDGYDLRSLEWIGSGGAPLGKDVIRAFAEKYPNVILAQGYGLTETTGAAFRAFTAEESRRRGSVGTKNRRWGSVGPMLGNLEAKIVDPDTGTALPPRKQGELWLRGPTIMKGYVNNAKATSETLVSDGWLRTGDICYFDDDGHLFVVDRLKELIKYKGYQIPPSELEQVLQSHPQILDAAVIPYPDEEAGEVPMGFVVRRPGSSLDERQVMDFVAKEVAPYKKVRRVAFVISIPKSAAGKILRKELRKIALLESKI